MMDTEHKLVENACFQQYSSKISRRTWHGLAFASASTIACSSRSSIALGFAEKDWLYFHYQREPKALSEAIEKLRTLPERMAAFYRLKLTVKPAHVVIFANRAAYLNHLDKTLPKAPRRTSLFVVRGGNPTILAADGDSLKRDLLHESVHVINYANFGSENLPLWLDEGTAEWFEADETQQAMVHGEMIATIMGDQRKALAMPLKLTSIERITTTTKADALSYAASWAWSRFLGDPATACHRIWLRYLADIQSGIVAGMLSHRLALAVPNYEELFLRSLSLKTLSK